MITWKLWRLLLHPPRKAPLFQWALREAKDDLPRLTSTFFLWGFLISGLSFCLLVTFKGLPLLFFGMVIVVHSLFSLMMAVNMSGGIVREKEQFRFDLMGVLPLGTLGMSWAIGMGCLHRYSLFHWLLMVMRFLTIIALLTLIAALGFTMLVLSQIEDVSQVSANFDLVPMIIGGIALIVVFYLDHVYSILTASLIGMLASIDIEVSVEAQLRTLVGFLFVQFSVYGFCYYASFIVLPDILDSTDLSVVEATLSTVITGIVGYLILREGFIRLLWYYFMIGLNINPIERETLFTQ